MKKSTFEDWSNGNVTLIYAKSVFKESNRPNFVTWGNFNEADVIKIKETQKAIFNKTVEKKLEELKSNFFKNYGNSKVKEEFLKIEKQECLNILSLPIPKQKTIITTYWTVFFEYDDLVEIQDYVNETIVRGIDRGYDFIHSPKSKYQETGKIPSQAYAQIVYDYFEWLKDNFKRVEEKDKSEKKDKTELLWFKVGIFFATGEMDILIKKHTEGEDSVPNCTAISEELGNKSFRPYISESFSGTNENDKNIFSNEKKVQVILEYCNKNKIIVAESFIKRTNNGKIKQY